MALVDSKYTCVWDGLKEGSLDLLNWRDIPIKILPGEYVLAKQVLMTTLGFLCLHFGCVRFWASSLLGIWTSNMTEDMVLAQLRRPIHNGLSMTVPKHWCSFQVQSVDQ